MRKYERVIGIAYIPVHSYGLAFVFMLLFRLFKTYPSAPTYDLLYYGVSAMFLLLSMNVFWRQSIRDIKRAPIIMIQAIVLGYVLEFAGAYAVNFALSFVLADLVNPNSAAINAVAAIDPRAMALVSVVLAPIVEETMFRGALFGTIRTKNRVAAYIVSVAAFAIYHLWWELAKSGWNPRTCLYLLQYVPAGIALAWCYEKSETIVGPVILHALINLL